MKALTEGYRGRPDMINLLISWFGSVGESRESITLFLKEVVADLMIESFDPIAADEAFDKFKVSTSYLQRL